MTWKVPEEVQKLTWSVIQYPTMSVVVPSVDSEPHNIESMICKCEPRTEVMDGFHHVVHNSFIDKSRINDSLKSLGI